MKKSILLWAAGSLLGISAATAALAPENNVTPQAAPAPQPFAVPTSVTPANYTALIGKTEGVSDIDIIFDGATKVEINSSVKPMVTLGGYAGEIKASTMYATYTATEIDGGVRLSVVGAYDMYGKAENRFTYSAGTNGLNVALPEGFVTVTGADGVSRPSKATALRYTFANHHKVNPIGIADNADLMPEELTELIFPANLQLGANTSAAGFALLQAPEVYSGKWVNVKNADNYSAYFKPYLNEDDGLMHARWNGIDLNTVAPGQYNIVLFGKNVITVDGEDEGGCWIYPVNIVNVELTDLAITLAQGSQAESSTLPAFRFDTAGTDFNPVIGAPLNATVEGTQYPLDLKADGTLTFTETAAAELTEKYMNAPAFTVTFDLPAKSVKFRNSGTTYANNAISSQCTLRLFTPMDASTIVGDYYVKNMTVDLSEDLAFGADTPKWDERTVSIVKLSDADGRLTVGLKGLLLVTETIPGIVIPEKRQIIFGPYDYTEETDEVTNLQFTSTAGLDTPVIATIDGRGGIYIENFAQYDKPSGKAMLYNGNATLVPNVQGIVPAATEDLTLAYDYDLDAIIAKMTCPANDIAGAELPNLTKAVITLNDAQITTRDIDPGKAVTVVIVDHPAPGTTYTATATFHLCKEQGAQSQQVEYTYNPLAKEDIQADYFVTALHGEHIYYQGFDGSTFAVSSLDEGEFDKNAYNQKIEFGEIVNGKCTVKITNLLPSLSLYGTLDVVTHKITFNRGDNREYTVAVQNQLYDVPLYLVAGDGTAEKYTDATATLHDGLLSIEPCTFLILSERTYSPVLRIDRCNALVNKHIAPAAPIMRLSIESSADTYRVNGTVTVPSYDAQGNDLHPESAGHCAVYVYRMDSEAAPLAIDNTRLDGLTLIHSASQLAPGDERDFTDENVTVGETYIYLAFAEHLDNVNYDDYAMDAIRTTAIANLVANPDALVTVYDLRGVCLLSNAPRAALATLPAGIYLINGIKTALAR